MKSPTIPCSASGVDNFAVDFARERSTGEEPLYPHSLALRAFSQTGLIGGALFLGFVAAALAAALPRRKEPDSLSTAVAAAALASGVYWLVHGSIDWLWEIPALGASALALLGLASGLARSKPRVAVRIRGPIGSAAGGRRSSSLSRRRLVRAAGPCGDRARTGRAGMAGLARPSALAPRARPRTEPSQRAGRRRRRNPGAARRRHRTGPRGVSASARAESPRLVRPPPTRAARRRGWAERGRTRSPRACAVAQPARARRAQAMPAADLDFACRSRAAGSATGRLQAGARTGEPVRRGRRLNEMYAPARDPIAARRSLGALAATTACLLLAVVVSLVLSRYPPTLELATAAGLGLVAILALALIRQEAAAALGFALLGVVIIEPAPADLVFFVVIAIALATGSFRIQRVPAAAVGIVGAFFALNLVSAIEVVDYERAVTFFATTAYVAVLAIWLAGWVTNRRRAKVVAGGYVAAATLSASLGMLALFLPFPGGELMVFEDRVQALFKDPNVFGPFLVPAILILMEETLTPRLFGFGRVLKGLLLLLLTLGLIFSYSRGAWANLAIGVGMVLLVMAMRRGGGRKVLLALVLTLVAGALVAGAVSLSWIRGLPRRPSPRPELRRRPFRRSGGRARAGPAISLRRRARPVRARGPDLRSQHVRARLRRARAPGNHGVRRAPDLHAGRGVRERRCGTRHLRDRLGCVAGGMVRDPRQQLRHRHAPLAASVGGGRPHLGGMGTATRRPVPRFEAACGGNDVTGVTRRGTC